jgi:SAM-dependent methyltransferase
VSFRTALLDVPPLERDAWVDRALGIDAIPDDGPELPRECVPYLPCPVDAVLRAIELAGIGADDVVVDVGAGIGRAAALIHSLTGAEVIGIEIQPPLADAARALAARLGATGMTTIDGDAVELASTLTRASVFFLYCPFGGARLARLLDALPRTRPLRICTVDVPLPSRPWLALVHEAPGNVAVHLTRPDRDPST